MALLTTEELKSLCKIGTGPTTCRYLVCGRDGFECAKHQPELASVIDQRVADGLMNAVGDNCEGKQ